MMKSKAKFTLVFILGCLLTALSAAAQSKAMTKTFKLGNLEVAEKDLSTGSYSKTFEEAKKGCAELGEDWRLPTPSELDTLFKYKDKINIRFGTYWSSQEYNFNINDLVYAYAWGKLFTTGAKYFYHVKDQLYARPVKTINTAK